MDLNTLIDKSKYYQPFNKFQCFGKNKHKLIFYKITVF